MKTLSNNIFISALILVTFLAGCGNRKSSQRLQHIAKIASDHPKDALASLDSLDYNTLTNADQALYDFLTIKASDKADIKLVNDSIYLRVIDYYSKHTEDSLYPEVLYYGGRVYREIGDYPRALNYFQESLANAPNVREFLDLKSRVLSQTARILNSLRLYDKAIPYLKESLRIDSLTNDSIALMLDHQLLGSVNLHSENFVEAEKQYLRSKELAKSISRDKIYLYDTSLAIVKLKKNLLDSSLNLIRPILQNHALSERHRSLACGIESYYKSQIYDTAYMYVNEIIKSNDKSNRRFALHIALKP